MKRAGLISKIIFPILTLLWMGLIFFFSGQNAAESGGLSGSIVKTLVTFFYGDSFISLPLDKQNEILSIWSLVIRKGAHFSIFGVLGVLSFFSAYSFYKSNYSYLIAIAITFLYACSDEFHQTFVSGRAGMFTDVLIDTSGGIVFLAVLFLILWGIKSHRLKNKRE